MAKLSMKNREIKRARIVEQYAARRTELKETIRDPANSDEQRREAQKRLQMLPRDAAERTELALALGFGSAAAGTRPRTDCQIR